MTHIKLNEEQIKEIINSNNEIDSYKSLKDAILKNEGLTKEEIEENKIDIFEHIRLPEDKINVISIYRLLDILPVIEQILLDEFIDMLTAKNIFRQHIKAKLNQVKKLLETINNDVWKTCNKSGEDTKQAQEDWYSNMFDFATKFANALKSYIVTIETLSNASNTLEPIKRNEIILSKAKFISQLNEGDIFVFLDSQDYIEYTYVKTDKQTDDFKFYYKKKLDDDYIDYVPFYTDNAFKPVLNVSLITKELKEELLNILNHANTNN